MSQKSKYDGLFTLNGDLLCSIGILTTGEEIGNHDIYDIAILPLTAQIKPYSKILPFETLIIPERFDDIKIKNKDFANATLSGLDSGRVIDLLVQWFDNINLGRNKHIFPLVHNARRTLGFINEWLGPKTFNYIFDPYYRDLVSIAYFENDVCEFNIETHKYPKVDLGYLCVNPKLEPPKTALEQAVVIPKIYRHYLKFKSPNHQLVS